MAIPLPLMARAEIEGMLEETRIGSLPGVRVTPEADWHITLKFLGDVPEEKIELVKGALEISVSKMEEAKPLKVELESLAYGPNKQEPRMVWVKGSQRSSEVLGKFRDIFNKELEMGGVRVEKDNRTFQTHVTVARFGGEIPRNLPALPVACEALFFPEEVALMESCLSPSGAEYVSLHSIGVDRRKGFS